MKALVPNVKIRSGGHAADKFEKETNKNKENERERETKRKKEGERYVRGGGEEARQRKVYEKKYRNFAKKKVKEKAREREKSKDRNDGEKRKKLYYKL